MSDEKFMRKISTASFFILLISLGIFAQKSHSEIVSENARIQKINQFLTEREKDGLSGVILIRSRDKILLYKAYGVADREKKKRTTLKTGFDIGSLVKAMTAAGILRLEEQGKLSTKDKLSRFFPNIPEDKKNITIEQVLAHKAGLVDSFGSDYEVVSRDWIEEKTLNAALVSPPGEKRIYSNSGYSLLAIIIEKASGKSYEKFMREEVFKSAGVKKIGYVSAGWKNKNLAVGYYDDKRWGSPLDKNWAKDGPGWKLRGNGGMLGTVEETVRWYESLLEGKILKPETLQKHLADSSGMSRSLGERVILQAGGNDVFNSVYFTVVPWDFHLAFFTSNAKYEAEKVLENVRDDVFELAREINAAK